MSETIPERQALCEARRIVVKVGTSTLTESGALRVPIIAELAEQVTSLIDEGRQIVVVSSGAIAVGSHRLGWDHAGRNIREKQAAAAVGQAGLVEIYRQHFEARDRHVAQVLLTIQGLTARTRRENARNALDELLQLGVVPIVNENDTVSVEEIRFGDNDNLAAAVVDLVGADLLILLTDVDGLYTEKPRAGAAKPTLYEIVEKITPEIEAVAGRSESAFARGGMATKLEAASKAALSGAATVICNGSRSNVLREVCAGEPVGTLFLPGEKLRSLRYWLHFTAQPLGTLEVDDGATRALLGSSANLLPAGIVKVEGNFEEGDPVAVRDSQGREIGRGLTAYSAAEIQRIKGLPAREVERVLGSRASSGAAGNGAKQHPTYVISREKLVVLDES